MRTGELNCLVTIVDFITASDGAGGTIYVQFDEDYIATQFSDRVLYNPGHVVTSDCGANYLTDYFTERTAWAYLNQKTGTRGLDGSQIELENYTELYFHYDDVSDISKKWLLRFEDRNFTIHSYEIIREKKRLIKVKAVEVK